MTDEEMIEQVGRAIRQALSDGAPWDSEPEDFTEEAEVCARAALAAINLPARLEAADRIEALEAENERLREALEWYVAEDEKYIRAARAGDTYETR